MRLDYQHRWLGTIIEDGTADPTAAPSCSPTPATSRRRRSTTRPVRDATGAATPGGPDPNDPALPASAVGGCAASTLVPICRAWPTRRSRSAPTTRSRSREQALRQELADARVVHVFAADRQLRGALPGRAELLRAQRQQRLRHARPVQQPERSAAQRPPPPVPRRRLLHAPDRQRPFTFGLSFSARSGMPRNYVVGAGPRPGS